MSGEEDKLKLLIASRFLNQPLEAGVVYYIACPETKRMKIGYTAKSPEARLRALQTGSPTELRLMAIHPGFIEDERFIHDWFGARRLHGEWFEVDEHLFEHIAYVCWVAAVNARYVGQETPPWAQIGLDAIEQHWGPAPTDLGGRLQ